MIMEPKELIPRMRASAADEAESPSRSAIPYPVSYGQDPVADLSWSSTPPVSPEVTAYLARASRSWPLVDLRTLFDKEHLTNFNTQITELFQQAICHIKAEAAISNDPKAKKNLTFRVRAFQNAIDTISAHPAAIRSGAEARQLPGIGKGLADRVDEILRTGRLTELHTDKDDYVRMFQELTSIHGIGPVTARKLIEQHQITGLDDLVTRYSAGLIKVGKHQLTHHQLVGMRYAKDLMQKIPRAEIQKIEERLRRVIGGVDKQLLMQLCGSYRRGKALSGDIDMLLTHPHYRTRGAKSVAADTVSRVVEALRQDGLLLDQMVQGEDKFMGVVSLGGTGATARQLDIRFVPFDSYATGLLYFTGSKNFNEMFRGKALTRGYTVSEWAVLPLGPEYPDGKGPPIPVYSEADIFALVGVRYLMPHQREF